VTLLQLSLKSDVIDEYVFLRYILPTEDFQQTQSDQTFPGDSRRPWLIACLLFVVAFINYFDRQSLSVVAPRFQQELHLSDQGYGHVVSLFLLASAFAYAVSGFITDRFGTRRSMALFVGWWSLAEAATAFATSTLQLSCARFCLGLGEPGLWVAAPKAVGENFERPQRSLAIGIYTMGATVGAVVAIPIIAAVTTHLPWKAVFLIDGAAGLIWLPFWLFGYRNGLVAQSTTASGALREVLSRGKTWKLMVARGLTDPVWYFYLFWFPKYLLTARHMSMTQLAKVGWIVYLAAGIGTLLGGVASGRLIRRGMTAGFAYRRIMLVSAILIPISPLAGLVPTAALAIGIASVIALAHMAWLVNLTSTIIELFPANQVGKAAGLVAAGSGLGGMVSSEIIGHFVAHQGYLPVFYIMAVLHPIALVILWKAFADVPNSGVLPLANRTVTAIL
jgi:ACS family hexuronate transporter-like MFS transporter